MAQFYKTIIRNKIRKAISQMMANIAAVKIFEISKLAAMKSN
jgi:hypothetical protein